MNFIEVHWGLVVLFTDNASQLTKLYNITVVRNIVLEFVSGFSLPLIYYGLILHCFCNDSLTTCLTILVLRSFYDHNVTCNNQLISYMYFQSIKLQSIIIRCLIKSPRPIYNCRRLLQDQWFKRSNCFGQGLVPQTPIKKGLNIFKVYLVKCTFKIRNQNPP